jgi:glucose/mannose-6-phosphate isomerase
MMREIIYSLPNQIAAAVGFVPDFPSSRKRYNNVLVCGMGGSGISGEILSVVYPGVQVFSNKDYDIPGFVDKNTLAILVSYSGNTEETLNNYRQLAARKLDMVLLSSDGKLYAKKACHKVKVPHGLPPRGALGYLFTPLPIIMYGARLIDDDPRKKMLDLAKFLTKERDAIERVAQKLAPKFVDRLLIIYSNSSTFKPVANRWQCQLNENAKIFAHVNVIPEMNHNEIVGLGRPKKLNRDASLVFLNDPSAHRRNKLRVRVLKELVRNELQAMVDVEPCNESSGP